VKQLVKARSALYAIRSFIVSPTKLPTQSLSVPHPPSLHPYFVTVTTKTSRSVISNLSLFTFAFIFYFRYYLFPSYLLYFPLFFVSLCFSHSLRLPSLTYLFVFLHIFIPLSFCLFISSFIYVFLPLLRFFLIFLLFLKFFVFISAIPFPPLLFLCFLKFPYLVLFFVVF
jgi:hypothetical protein